MFPRPVRLPIKRTNKVEMCQRCAKMPLEAWERATCAENLLEYWVGLCGTCHGELAGQTIWIVDSPKGWKIKEPE